ncbi:FMN-binding negative transcriptional regulator [uncultured Propionivibrio sp.]|uniref:FMN-binding negative transcriptional regulator n=1 Tax=uncultured Propionivibrio sp. TaxID=426737 RepID=UPI0029BFC5A3|nr:FMN-binding negative transcriptional regulator [uncultured Propionivibrio sp.]
MYLPQIFAEPRIEEFHRIIRENSLGMLVTNTANGLEANHLPFLLDERPERADVLIAHVARANPIWCEVHDGDPVLVVFRGVDGYISPNWYPGKQETHRRVPTWNYEVVHAHGTIHIHDDEKFVRGVVGRLTRQHEADQPTPWKMSDAPRDFMTEELSHIIGIEIRLSCLQGKRKLNQHHNAQDREGAIRGLEVCGNYGLAQAMKDSTQTS